MASEAWPVGYGGDRMTLKLEPYKPEGVVFTACVQDAQGTELDRVNGGLPRALVWDWLRDWRASVTRKYGALEAVDFVDQGGRIHVLATLVENPGLAA